MCQRTWASALVKHVRGGGACEDFMATWSSGRYKEGRKTTRVRSVFASPRMIKKEA